MVRLNELTTVRIMAISVKGYDTHDILIVSTLNDIDDRMKRIRVFVKESEWNKEILEIANHFYIKLVSHREKLRKRVLDKHLYDTYMEISNNRQPMFGLKRLYIKNVKSPMNVLKKPRKGYSRVESDTLRLFIRDLVLEQEKKIYKGELESDRER